MGILQQFIKWLYKFLWGITLTKSLALLFELGVVSTKRDQFDEGKFGRIFHATKLYAEGAYVLKVIDLRIIFGQKYIQALWEYVLTADFDHLNIISFELLQSYPMGNNPSILTYIMPYYPRTLAAYIAQAGPLSEDAAKYLSRQLLEVLIYLRGKQLLHCDITTKNIFVDEKGARINIIVADFSLIYTYPAGVPTTDRMGTICYRPPEVEVTNPAEYVPDTFDVYSSGCCIYEMITGRPFLTADNSVDVLEQMKGPIDWSINNAANTAASAQARSMIIKMVAFNSTDRREANELIRSAWLYETSYEFYHEDRNIDFHKIDSPSQQGLPMASF